MENNEEAERTNELRQRKLTNINKEMSTKEAYFASLEEWAKQATLVPIFPNYLFANYNYQQLFQTQLPYAASGIPLFQPNFQARPQAVQQPQQPTNQPQPAAPVARPNFNRFRVLDEAQQQEIIQRVGGTEMVVAPFWKRALAEAIDVIILFVLKIVVTFSLFHLFELDFDRAMLKTVADDDIFLSFLDISINFFTISSDLILIEFLTKLLVCCYECTWTVLFNGATPGKSVMKIRILYVEAVVLLPPVMPQFVFQAHREPLRAVLYPAETPTFLRAMMRALVKNLVMTLLFPICVVMVFFKNNRTAYDVLTKTIVVETNRNQTPVAVPPQRPHQQ